MCVCGSVSKCVYGGVCLIVCMWECVYMCVCVSVFKCVYVGVCLNVCMWECV
jgi:hypothetical protein